MMTTIHDKYSLAGQLRSNIKFLGARMFGTPYANAEDDAIALVHMAASFQFKKLPDNNEYWCCFIKRDSNIEIAKFILARNGFNATRHDLPNYFPLLATPAGAVKENPKNTEFINMMSDISLCKSEFDTYNFDMYAIKYLKMVEREFRKQK